MLVLKSHLVSTEHLLDFLICSDSMILKQWIVTFN